MTSVTAYELDDLHQAMLERMEDTLLPAITRANRTGEFVELLCLMEMSDLINEE